MEPDGFWDHPKRKHFLLVAQFFISKCLLSATDILTDIITAKHFFESNNFYWGICTALPLFAPFVAKIVQSVAQVAMCFSCGSCKTNEVRLKILRQELANVIWSFPLLNPFR